MIDFDQYIAATNIVVADVFIPKGAAILIDVALREVKERIDTAGYSLSGVDVKAKLVDFRTGNIYQIFSASFLNEYPAVPHWYAVEYNKEYVDSLEKRISALESALPLGKTDISLVAIKKELKVLFTKKSIVLGVNKHSLKLRLKGIA